MNALAVRALELVRAHAAKSGLGVDPTPVAKPQPRGPKLRYAELAGFIAAGDTKGVVDVFGDVKGEIEAHRLAEYCIARWDMTPEVYECIKHHLISPLTYPIIYDMPDGDYVEAGDFAEEWQFKRYCTLIELAIKTRPGFIDMVPFINANLRIAGLNAIRYRKRYQHAKIATVMELPTFAIPAKPTIPEMFAYISYQFHNHNLKAIKSLSGHKMVFSRINADSIAHLENHFEFCDQGEACTINKIVGIFINTNPEFVVSAGFKATFETITGRISAPKSELKTITNARRCRPRGKSQMSNDDTLAADEA